MPTSVVVGEEDVGKRLQKFCLERFKAVYGSRKLLIKAIERGEVRVNGDKVEDSRKLLLGDVVTHEYNKQETLRERDGKTLSVLFENEHVAIVWKEAGVVVSGRRSKTLEAALPYNLTRPLGEWIVGTTKPHPPSDNQSDSENDENDEDPVTSTSTNQNGPVTTWGVGAPNPMAENLPDGFLARPIAMSTLVRPACGLVAVAKSGAALRDLSRILGVSASTARMGNTGKHSGHDGEGRRESEKESNRESSSKRELGSTVVRYHAIVHGRVTEEGLRENAKSVSGNLCWRPIERCSFLESPTDDGRLRVENKNDEITPRDIPNCTAKMDGLAPPDVIPSRTPDEISKADINNDGNTNQENDHVRTEVSQFCAIISEHHPDFGEIHIHPINVFASTSDTGWLHAIDIWVKKVLPAGNIRKFLEILGYPIVGNCAHTVPTRGTPQKGLFMAITELRLSLPSLGVEAHAIHPIPVKFNALRAREEKFHSRKLAARMEALGLEGVEGVEIGPDAVPVAYLLQEKIFCGLKFKVTPDVLIPRPSTETLVHAVFQLATQAADINNMSAGPHLLDLGTGSGCILLACLQKIPHATGVGVDLSEEALSVARENAQRHGLSGRSHFGVADFGRLHESDEGLPDGLRRSDRVFDVIVCNPPYLPNAAKLDLSSANHEPALALYAGNKGLGAYGAIAASLARRQPALLRRGGHLVLEVGAGLSDHVTQIVKSALGWPLVARHLDPQNLVRCLVFCNQSSET